MKFDLDFDFVDFTEKNVSIQIFRLDKKQVNTDCPTKHK